MRVSEDQLRSVVLGITEHAIITTDTEGVIRTWNTGAEMMFGYSAKEAIGKHSSIIYTPEDLAAGVPQEEMRRARQDGQAPDERWHVRNDGSRFFVSGVLMPIGDPVRGFVKMARDLSKSKEAEEMLKRAYDELEDRIAERTRELAQANADLRREIAERTESEKARVQLLRRIVAAQEDERTRIARDLHDQLGQQTTALRLTLESLKKQCGDRKDLETLVLSAQEVAKKLDASVDFLAWELRPAGLDDLGLRLALGNYVKEWSTFSGIAADFHTGGFEEQLVAPEVEVNLYRIAQEALNNVLKHAGATRVDVLLERRDHNVVLIIEDNGVGFDIAKVAAKSGSMGVAGMRERALVIMGRVQIESTLDEGTTVFVRAPMNYKSDSVTEKN